MQGGSFDMVILLDRSRDVLLRPVVVSREGLPTIGRFIRVVDSVFVQV